MQRDAGNAAVAYPNTVVVAVSSQGRENPFHVRLRPNAQNGLKGVSFVKCEQIFTVSKERLGSKLGSLRAEEMRSVSEAIRLNLALEDDSPLLH